MALFTVNPNAVINPGDVNQFTNLLNGTTTGTAITVSNRIRAQNTGTNSMAGGYVGQVAGSFPSGSFVSGDFASDGTLGLLWKCVAGGSPGTWLGSMAGVSSNLLTSPVASVSFSSIPQGYTHLVLFMQIKSAFTATGFLADNVAINFNGVTTSGYNSTTLFNTNSSTASARFSGAQNTMSLASVWTSFPANTPGSGNLFCFIPYYSQSLFGKQVIALCHSSDGGGAAQVSLTAGAQNIIVAQAAITSIAVALTSGSNFVTGSYFSLYGIS